MNLSTLRSGHLFTVEQNDVLRTDIIAEIYYFESTCVEGTELAIIEVESGHHFMVLSDGIDVDIVEISSDTYFVMSKEVSFNRGGVNLYV